MEEEGNKTWRQNCPAENFQIGLVGSLWTGILKAPFTLPRAALPLHQGNGPSILPAREVTFVISLVFGSSNKQMSKGQSKAVRQGSEHQGGMGPALPMLVS